MNQPNSEVVEAGLSLGIPQEDIEILYVGYFNSDEDFALYNLEQMRWDLRLFPFNCIDLTRAGQYLMSDHVAFNGHYFRM